MTLERSRQQYGIPETYGVRVFAKRDDERGTVLAINFVEGPEDGDSVTVQHGTRLFVARELAGPLADRVVHVAPDPSGKGSDIPRLVIRRQAA